MSGIKSHQDFHVIHVCESASVVALCWVDEELLMSLLKSLWGCKMDCKSYSCSVVSPADGCREAWR